jgi:hypothetical protein
MYSKLLSSVVTLLCDSTTEKLKALTICEYISKLLMLSFPLKLPY